MSWPRRLAPTSQTSPHKSSRRESTRHSDRHSASCQCGGGNTNISNTINSPNHTPSHSHVMCHQVHFLHHRIPTNIMAHRSQVCDMCMLVHIRCKPMCYVFVYITLCVCVLCVYLTHALCKCMVCVVMYICMLMYMCVHVHACGVHV